MHAQMAITKVEGIVALRPQAAHMARALPSFCGMTQLGILLLPPGIWGGATWFGKSCLALHMLLFI